VIRRVLSAVALGAAGVSLALTFARGGTTAATGTPAPPTANGDWRTVLDRAVEASRGSAYEGRLLIVGFGEHGPDLAEVDIAQGTGGGLRVGRAEAWMVGRQSDDAFYWQPQAGTLLRLGNVDRPQFSIDDLTEKYAVDAAGSTDLRTGPALVLSIRERGREQARERLYVDEATGLVVRRDTFGPQGQPSRVVAFTELEVSELSINAPEGVDATHRGAYRSVSDDGLGILGRVGWSVPRQLPAGFTLRNGYALPESNGASLHLVYSDGLYTLSIYEQFGRVDPDAFDDAASVVDGETHVYRWPGSEPERMVWTGDGKTFTAISDAPYDQVLATVGGFPNDPPSGLRSRMERGVARVAGWLWPFD
jgi:hypothetical protein